MSHTGVVWVLEVTNISGTYPNRGEIHIRILLIYKDNILGMVKSQETINLVRVHIHKGVIHLSIPSHNRMDKILGLYNIFGVLLFKEEIHLRT